MSCQDELQKSKAAAEALQNSQGYKDFAEAVDEIRTIDEILNRNYFPGSLPLDVRTALAIERRFAVKKHDKGLAAASELTNEWLAATGEYLDCLLNHRYASSD